ncbi:MAG: hypothetical protein LAP21_14305, partial [Acidobacteriia bacterium]|nr:hypothetical protein [Terriglobia bacterium]
LVTALLAARVGRAAHFHDAQALNLALATMLGALLDGEFFTQMIEGRMADFFVLFRVGETESR